MGQQTSSETLKAVTVADGTYESDILSAPEMLNGTMYIRFLDSNLEQVLPATGTALFEVSEDGFNWADVTNGSVDVTVGDYPRPGYVQGYTRYFRVTLTSVTGANSFEAVLIKNCQ